MDNIYLVGSSDVQQAGNSMRNAASDMQGAARSINVSVQEHKQVLDSFIQELEILLERHFKHDPNT